MTYSIDITKNLAACHALRNAVFVQEQGVSASDEIDTLDAGAVHLLATTNEGGTPVGTARLLLKGEIGKIGRVCVLPAQRGTGLGAALIRASLDHLATLPGITTAKLGSQTQALGFYERLGFTAVGDIYDDAGIPHQDMTKPL